MAGAIAFIQWESYAQGADGRGLFASDSLSYNSRQDRLHKLDAADRLWLVSRCPDDQQYYFVGLFVIARASRNPPGSELAKTFGEFAVIADRQRSRDFNRKFPAEGLLRAFAFENAKPIKVGASLGQSLQAIRFLSAEDEGVLDMAAGRINVGDEPVLDTPFGLWTKCDAVFANYFLANWNIRHEPLAFLLYDSPPVLPAGAPVFIHSDKNLRIVASFRESQFVTGYKPSAEANERIAERERVWQTYRQDTIGPPAKSDFDKFWDAQHGVRALFLMSNLVEVSKPVPFKNYGRALEWGYPMGVGYRYLSLSQSVLMLRAAELPDAVRETYFSALLKAN